MSKAKRNAPNVVALLRQEQEADRTLGPLFASLYAYAERINDEFYEGELPYFVITMNKDRSNRRGSYVAQGGTTLGHSINLDPFVIKDGLEAGEVLAHEMVHLWQAHVGRPCLRNYHNIEFHQRMADYGILTKGNGGEHVGATDKWIEWQVAAEEALQLSSFLLPGMDRKPTRRKLRKYQCELCRKSFRARTFINATCADCDAPFQVVPTRKDEDHA